MKYALAITLVAFSTPGYGQDLPFSSDATEACLETATTRAEKEMCIGLSAGACSDTPDGSTTVGMGFCFDKEASYWDARLNAAFAALMRVERALVEEIKSYGGFAPDAPAALRDMQRAWIGYRDATCAYEYTTWGGGTGGGPANAACLMYETGRQTLILEDRLSERSQ